MDDRRDARSVGRAIAAGLGSSGLDEPAIRVVVRQTPGAMEYGQDPIRIFVHPHRDLHIMEPVWGLRDQYFPIQT
jgi:hypothetical protein